MKTYSETEIQAATAQVRACLALIPGSVWAETELRKEHAVAIQLQCIVNEAFALLREGTTSALAQGVQPYLDHDAKVRAFLADHPEVKP